MKKSNIKKLALSSLLIAVAVVGSAFFRFPVFGSNCSPTQHLVNVICAVFLGPSYGVVVAFIASILRNLFGIGSLMAFPGSMCGALICGLIYKYSSKIIPTLFGEVLGTSLLGGLLAYPLAKLIMGLNPAGFTVYIIPFFISTFAGSLIAAVIIFALKKSKAFNTMTNSLNN